MQNSGSEQIMAAALFIVLFTVVFGAIVFLLLSATKWRTQSLKQVAQELHWQFYPQGSDRIQPFLANLDFFEPGQQKRIRNLMLGKLKLTETPLSVAVFDYSFTVGRHDDTDTYCQTIALFLREQLALPAFQLRPEHLLDKVGNAIGRADINFPDAPQFSKHFRLTSAETAHVYRLFQPALRQLLMDHPVCAEVKGSYLMIYPAGDRITQKRTIRIINGREFTESRFLSATEIRPFLDTGTQLMTLLSANAHSK